MHQFIPAVVLALSLAPQPAVGSKPAPNTLTAAEKAAGWQLLFDGTSLDAWRGYKREIFSSNDVVDLPGTNGMMTIFPPACSTARRSSWFSVSSV